MRVAGALRKAEKHAACERGYTTRSTGAVAISGQLNHTVPERERNRRRIAWSSPKNNYTSAALCKYGQRAWPAGSRAVTYPGASVEVVCHADV